MTLNGPYFVFFTEFDCFPGQYVTVVEYRPVMTQFQSCIIILLEKIFGTRATSAPTAREFSTSNLFIRQRRTRLQVRI